MQDTNTNTNTNTTATATMPADHKTKNPQGFLFRLGRAAKIFSQPNANEDSVEIEFKSFEYDVYADYTPEENAKLFIGALTEATKEYSGKTAILCATKSVKEEVRDGWKSIRYDEINSTKEYYVLKRLDGVMEHKKISQDGIAELVKLLPRLYLPKTIKISAAKSPNLYGLTKQLDAGEPGAGAGSALEIAKQELVGVVSPLSSEGPKPSTYSFLPPQPEGKSSGAHQQDHQTCLMQLVAKGDVRSVAKFLEDPEPNQIDISTQQGDTALTIAIDKGNLEMVKCLVLNGAKLDLEGIKVIDRPGVKPEINEFLRELAGLATPVYQPQVPSAPPGEHSDYNTFQPGFS
jgi:hypothetical protein